MWLTTNGTPTGYGRELRPGDLHRALVQLKDWQLEAHQLSRVSVDADGTMQLEAETEGSLKWFSYASGRLHRAVPRQDRKIPLLNTGSGPGLPTGLAVISYRPGRRVVLASTRQDPDIFLKGYRKGRGALAVKHHETALKASRYGAFQVPKLIDRYRDRDLLAMERQPGSTPDITIGNAPVWSGIGAALRRFQDTCDCSGLKIFTSHDELAVLDELARRLQLCDLDLPPGWLAGRALLGELAASLPTGRFGAAHRDLHDGQILLDVHGLSLLDFDLLCKADTALDAGNLLAHLALRDLQRNPLTDFSGSRACGQALLSGLQRRREDGFELRRLFYQSTTFHRLALLYTLRPRWQHLAHSLVNLGQQRIAEAEEYGG